MYAVIKIRGSIKLKKDIADTLKMLRLHRKNHCVLLTETKDIIGMLHKVKDYVTWGEISKNILKNLILKRGRKPGNRRITEEEGKKIFEEVKESKNNIGKLLIKLGVKPVFRLTPPSKGFKMSIKQHYPKGELGYRGEKINELLKRMI